MKKKLICMLLVFCLMFVLGACSPENVEYDNNEEIDIEEDAGSVSDDLSLLKCEPTEENDNSFFLLRNGTNYTLGGSFIDVNASNDVRALYGAIIDIDDGSRGFCSVGDIPTPVLQKEDLVVCYSDDRVPIMGLNKVDLYGYTLNFQYRDKTKELYYYTNNGDLVYEENASNVTITDSSGEAKENVFSLNEGESYTLGWYKGTKYNETLLVADSKVYALESSEFERDYEVEGTLTKDGYAEYDLSNIPAGTYRITSEPGVVWRGIITIE